MLFRIKLGTKPIFRILYILKINRIMPFCNLFMGRPSYYVRTTPQVTQKVSNNTLTLKCGDAVLLSILYNATHLTPCYASFDSANNQNMNKTKLIQSTISTNFEKRFAPQSVETCLFVTATITQLCRTLHIIILLQLLLSILIWT